MDKFLQVLRSTVCAFMLVGSASTFARAKHLYYLSQHGDFLGPGPGTHADRPDGTFSAPSPIPTLHI